MARLVPALPRFADPADETVGLALESFLDDAFVVIQRRPENGIPLMVLHPDLGVAVIDVLRGAHRWDADAEAWLAADGASLDIGGRRATLEKDAKDVLAKMSTSVPVYCILVSPDGLNGPASVDLLGAASDPDLADGVRDVMLRGAGEWDGGSAWITEFLRFLSPDATPYERGAIPAAQMSWRAKRIVETPTASQAPDRHIRPVNDKALLRLTEMCVESALDGRPATVAGLDIRAADIADPAFLLPAILIAAAEEWAPVVASRGGQGGFLVRLTKDKEALLGYRVVGITPSAPLLLFIPVLNLVHRSVTKGECVLDGTVTRFARWLRESNLDEDVVGNTRVRVVDSKD